MPALAAILRKTIKNDRKQMNYKLFFMGGIFLPKQFSELMKNGVFWDVTQRGYCKNRRFGGT
jgi:hypothetical protein